VSTSNPIADRNIAVVYIRRQSQRDQQFATDTFNDLLLPLVRPSGNRIFCFALGIVLSGD